MTSRWNTNYWTAHAISKPPPTQPTTPTPETWRGAYRLHIKKPSTGSPRCSSKKRRASPPRCGRPRCRNQSDGSPAWPYCRPAGPLNGSTRPPRPCPHRSRVGTVAEAAVDSLTAGRDAALLQAEQNATRKRARTTDTAALTALLRYEQNQLRELSRSPSTGRGMALAGDVDSRGVVVVNRHDCRPFIVHSPGTGPASLPSGYPT